MRLTKKYLLKYSAIILQKAAKIQGKDDNK